MDITRHNISCSEVRIFKVPSRVLLKGYCTVSQHALKSLEITGIIFSSPGSKGHSELLPYQ